MRTRCPYCGWRIPHKTIGEYLASAVANFALGYFLLHVSIASVSGLGFDRDWAAFYLMLFRILSFVGGTLSLVAAAVGALVFFMDRKAYYHATGSEGAHD